MTAQEFYIRKICLGERIRQLQAEAVVLIDCTNRHKEKNAMDLTAIHLSHAAEKLEHEAAPLELDLETALTLSIAQERDKRRCAEVASDNEKGPGGNLSPFSNRTTTNDQRSSGE